MGVFDWTGDIFGGSGGTDIWDFGDTGDFWGSFGDGGVLNGGDSGSWTDYLGGDWGDGGGSFLDFNGGDSSGGSSWVKGLTSLFGGGGSGSGSNIFGSLLSGLASGAAASLSGKDLKEGIQLKGKEDRKTIDFEASLKDYYTQEDKRRKRVALDTYGQFSMMDRIKKGYKDTPPVQVPTKPLAG